jgi:hypothetical protein
MAAESSEDAEAKSFWDGFFDVFGVSRRRVGTFERRVRKLDGKDGYIDLLWKGVLLIEHKSRGRDLDRAHAQARDYFAVLTDAELPRYLLVSDFARFRLYDLESDEPPVEFALAELHQHARRFGFVAGYQTRSHKEEDPVNIEAAERMGRLHDALKTAGYQGHLLEVLLVRLLFCLFADDTGIFPRHAFNELIAQRTSVDGADLGPRLAQLFPKSFQIAFKRPRRAAPHTSPALATPGGLLGRSARSSRSAPVQVLDEDRQHVPAVVVGEAQEGSGGDVAPRDRGAAAGAAEGALGRAELVHRRIHQARPDLDEVAAGLVGDLGGQPAALAEERARVALAGQGDGGQRGPRGAVRSLALAEARARALDQQLADLAHGGGGILDAPDQAVERGADVLVIDVDADHAGLLQTASARFAQGSTLE